MTVPSTSMKQEVPGGSLRDLLQVLFKHQAKILVIFFATVATVAIATFLTAPVYEATASLLVKIGREHIARIKGVVGTIHRGLAIHVDRLVRRRAKKFNVPVRQHRRRPAGTVGVDLVVALDSDDKAGCAELPGAGLDTTHNRHLGSAPR